MLDLYKKSSYVIIDYWNIHLIESINKTKQIKAINTHTVPL